MQVTKVVQVEQEVVANVVCNKCGRDIAAMREGQHSYAAHVEYSAGYNSGDGICDGDMFQFDLCEGCLCELMKSFKVPPTYHNFISGEPEQWDGWKAQK